MEDYTLIQAHTVLLLLFVFLLTAVSSYLWTSLRVQSSTRQSRATEIGVADISFKRRDTGMSPQQSAQQISSLAGEWLAPLIAWLVVIMATVAAVGLMFAQE